MAEVRLDRVTKRYEETTAVDQVSLTIHDGEFVVLVGPSGCGKSTTLRMIAGLESISNGDLYIDHQIVNNKLPKDRDIAMVFQNYALYPHMTVFENMAFGLKLKKTPKKEIKQRVLQAAEAVDLLGYLDRRPKALSGGQRQRVALGRAIVRDPKVFLFDEPLSNLDAKLRVQMRIEIARLQRRMQTTTIYVTHDQTEAMTMADRMAILKDGVLQQYDTPLQTYNFPANLFVAGFIGSPSMNFVTVSIDETYAFSDESGSFRIPYTANNDQLKSGELFTLGFRPEDFQPDVGGNQAPIKAIVQNIEPMGNETFLYLRVGPHQFTARVRPERLYRPGDIVPFTLTLDKLHFFDMESGRRIETD